MPTTRRANGASGTQKPPSMPPATPQASTSHRQIPPATHSPYLPTRTELLVLAAYPLILILGSLFSLSPTLQPPNNPSVYSHAAQSYQPASQAPSYFAQKTNIFNVYFVKIGWFWTTLAFLAFQLAGSSGQAAGISAQQSASDKGGLRRQGQAGLRWGLATGVWILTTQWCFGPPLVDRGFALSGGVCDVGSARLAQLQREHAGNAVDLIDREKEELAQLLTHAACKVAGGAWKGGYDISGHVFLLVLGSGMLLMEMLPYAVPGAVGLGLGRVLRTRREGDCRVGHEVARAGLKPVDADADEKTGAPPDVGALGMFATLFVAAVVGLSCWMLLMTSAFFHTWFEKLTGLVWALFGLWAIYLLPRGSPAFRDVFGMPGL